MKRLVALLLTVMALLLFMLAMVPSAHAQAAPDSQEANLVPNPILAVPGVTVYLPVQPQCAIYVPNHCQQLYVPSRIKTAKETWIAYRQWRLFAPDCWIYHKLE